MKKGILLSGGIDSISLLYWKKPDVAIFVDYGQVCSYGEFKAVTQVTKELKTKLEIIKVNCKDLGLGLLSGKKKIQISPTNEWWPFRNQLLITLASMKAIHLNVKELMIGCVNSDKQYVDGTINFINKINKLISIQEGNINITAPAIKMSSNELIIKSKIQISLLAWAHSCVRANYACGTCESCKKHQKIMYYLNNNPY